MSATRLTLSAIVLTLLFVGYHVVADEQKVVEIVSPVEPTLELAGGAPSLAAEAYVIFDVSTGDILASHNGEAVLPIASITKLVTAAAALDILNTAEEVQVTAAAVATYGEAGRLRAGQRYTYHELLFPLLLESSNDAAAVYELGTQRKVITAMNSLAQEAGAVETRFADASGLSDNNVSTAHELAQITTFLYKQYGHIFDISRLQNQAGTYVGWTNNNPVIAPRYLGGKHGYTEAAGRTIVSLFSEPVVEAQERVIGYIVLGSADLAADVASLRDFVATSVAVK